MNEKKNPHPPTGRQAGGQAERTDGAQLFQAFLGGGGREPAGARLLFLLLFSQFPAHLLPPPPPSPSSDSDPKTPWSSRPPPFKRRRRSPLAGAAARLHSRPRLKSNSASSGPDGVLHGARGNNRLNRLYFSKNMFTDVGRRAPTGGFEVYRTAEEGNYRMH